MTYFILNTAITALVVVTVSEVAKRSSLLGGVLASLPLVSLLAMLWLYIDTRDSGKVSELATSILWMILPSLSLFVLLPLAEAGSRLLLKPDHLHGCDGRSLLRDAGDSVTVRSATLKMRSTSQVN